MTTLHRLGGANMLEDGQMRVIDASGLSVLLVRVDGCYYAVQARCPHMRAQLVRGTLEGRTLACPAHGSLFDVTSGECIRWVSSMGRAVRFLSTLVSKPRNLETYSVEERDGLLWLAM